MSCFAVTFSTFAFKNTWVVFTTEFIVGSLIVTIGALQFWKFNVVVSLSVPQLFVTRILTVLFPFAKTTGI